MFCVILIVNNRNWVIAIKANMYSKKKYQCKHGCVT